MIGIVDYEAGNLASVYNALDRLGFPATILHTPQKISDADRLILPGVGSFRKAMEKLNSSGWTEALREYAASGRPLLGICLGMQVLFDEGDEDGPTPGLSIIPGRVVRMTPQGSLRLPHVGWNALTSIQKHPLFAGVKPHVDFYFVHSYHCQPNDPADTIASCDYGGEFTAAVARGSVAAMQFHPEKSQPAGLRILENFAEWDGTC